MSKFPISIAKQKKSKLNIVINVIIVILIAAICFQMFFYTRYSRVYVVGMSMYPTLQGATSSEESGGDYVYIDKNASPTYGDIIVINAGDRVLIKRVIALGGDRVALIRGTLYLNGQKKEEDYLDSAYNSPNYIKNTFGEITVPEGYIFFMGDNRDNSSDSRGEYGPMKASQVLGVVTSWSLKYKQVCTNWNTFFDFTLQGCS
jgi:signal peptidase I